MTRMRQFVCGSAALAAASLCHVSLAIAQEPAAGQDIAGKTIWLLPDSRLRLKPGLSPFNVYHHARTALQMTGGGRCDPPADCPVRFEGKDLWTRRTRLSLSPPSGLSFGSDGRPSGSPTTTSVVAPDQQRWLRPGETGEEVRRLQEGLNAKGYRVPVDGSYGSSTEQAVMQFQRSAGLTADGIAGRQVRDALAQSGGVVKAPIGATGTPIADIKERIKEKIARFKERIKGVATGGQPAIYRTLRNGDSGDDVRLLQEILLDKGFRVTVDGKFGDGTEDAVRQLQRSLGINPDGAVGPITLERLAA